MAISKKQKLLRATILETIYVKGPISRVDIAKDTHITPATTSSITSELLASGEILEIGEEESDIQKVGRKKILLTINPHHSFYIGSEITENYFTFTLTTNTGEMLTSYTTEISKSDLLVQGSQLYLYHLKKFISQNKEYSITAIGIAIPGRYLEGSKLIITDNQLWKDFRLDTIKKECPYPVYISNNVNCMAIAQRLFSPNQSDDNFIFFHFKRGMHCSYMYNGHIYGKNNAVIGEIGHTIVFLDGELCSCGKRGCLQTYLGEAWLLKKAKLLYENAPDSILKNIISTSEELSIEKLLLAYELGDPSILNLLHTAIKFLAQSLFNLSLLIDSQKIYLHSPLLSNPKLVKTLYEYITIEPKLLQTQIAPVVEIVPYNTFNCALSASGLAIQKWLLLN